MTTQSRKRRKHEARKGTTRAKGDIVEQIIASMHEMPGVTVERNVFLPTQDGSGRTGEIDVLLSSQVAGYTVRVAIECKNEKHRVGVSEVNEFIGKLHDVGIPTQQGILVSASGYTTGAALRAKQVGIKPLVLKDVTNDLPISIREAFQSIIYLLLTITNIQVQNDIGGPASASDILFFRDKGGKVCGSVHDLVWTEWLSGRIPDELGNHQIELSLPEGWMQIVKGKVAQVHGIKVDLQITGHVVTVAGVVRRMSLVDALTEKPERDHLEAKFDMPHGTYSVTSFATEEELEKSIHRSAGISVSTGRFRVPRIRWGAVYWPPSERAIQRMVTLMRAFEEGQIPDPRPFNFDEIEGEDMAEAWRPIWKEHPLVKRQSAQDTGY